MREYLTIGELSDLLKLSAHTIRYYEKEGLIKPKHITDKGYRLYDYEDIYAISSIMVLRDSDMPIKNIRELIQNYTKEQHQLLLQKSKAKVDAEIERLCALRIDVERTLKEFNNDVQGLNQIVKKEFKNRYFRMIKSSDYEMDYPIKELYDLYKSNRINTDGLYKENSYYLIRENTIGYGVMDFGVIENAIQVIFEKGTYMMYKFFAITNEEIESALMKFMWQISIEKVRYEGEVLMIMNSDTIVDTTGPVKYEFQLKMKD